MPVQLNSGIYGTGGALTGKSAAMAEPVPKANAESSNAIFFMALPPQVTRLKACQQHSASAVEGDEYPSFSRVPSRFAAGRDLSATNRNRRGPMSENQPWRMTA